MLERETDVILSTVRDRTIARRTSISMKEILASDIPYPIKMFFRTDVENSLLHELRQFRNGSRFGFDHPEIDSLQRQMNSILILNYNLSAEEFEKRLADVVHLVANYLIRPQWTMSGVLFEKEDAISTQELLRFLKYFGAYEYLRDISVRYIREKDLSSFTKKDFSLFLWKADGAYVGRKTGDELARILTPLYEFFDYPHKTNSNGMPVQALVKYFEDKGLSSVTARLEGEIQHATALFTLSELSDLLENIRRTNGAFIVDHLEQDPEVVATPLRNDPQPAPATVEPEPVIPKQLPLAGFTRAIDDGERKRFLKKIFRQDEHSFQTAMQFMGGLTSWKDASRFIDEIFIHNDVDPYSSDAKKFIDLIFKQFYPSQ